MEKKADESGARWRRRYDDGAGSWGRRQRIAAAPPCRFSPFLLSLSLLSGQDGQRIGRKSVIEQRLTLSSISPAAVSCSPCRQWQGQRRERMSSRRIEKAVERRRPCRCFPRRPCTAPPPAACAQLLPLAAHRPPPVPACAPLACACQPPPVEIEER